MTAMRPARAMVVEQLPSYWRQGDERTPIMVMSRQQPSVGCLLPHGKARARGAPCIEYFPIGPRFGTNKLQKIQY